MVAKRAGSRTRGISALAAAAALLAAIVAVSATATPAAAATQPAGALAVATGFRHSCALLENHTVKCWGGNTSGELGLGNTVALGDGPGEMGDSLPTVDLGTGRTATALSVGGYDGSVSDFTCALLDDGHVKCFGFGLYGQLGQGSTASLGDGPSEMGANLPAIALGTGRTATAISAGFLHACAILDNGSLKCWGDASSGQLGLGNTTRRGDSTAAGHQMGDSLPAVNLGAGRTAVAVAAGGYHTCALLDDGTVKCWGANYSGAVGVGSTNSQFSSPQGPLNFGAGRTATAIASGATHSCALLDDGTVKCWGSGIVLGLGTNTSVTAPAGPVNLGAGRTAVRLTGGGGTYCALLDDATVRCWGDNSAGQGGQESADVYIGDRSSEMGPNLAAIDLGTGASAVALSPGGRSVCALLQDRRVKCWGDNASGQLGQGNTTRRGDSTAAGHQMGDDLPAIDLGTITVANPSLSATQTADESSANVGADVHLHVTVTTTGDVPLTGITVTDPNEPDCEQAVPDLGVGEDHTVDCVHTATLDDLAGYTNAATVDSDQTDPVDSNEVEVAVSVPAASGGALAVGVGINHACALLDSYAVKCWGDNDYGQLGQGDTDDRGDGPGEMGDELAPVDVGSGRVASMVTLGSLTSCVRLDDHTAKCWGNNAGAQLGQAHVDTLGDEPGEMGDSLPAISLGTGRIATSVVAGTGHACALLDDGTVKCWGANTSGQLGLGNTTARIQMGNSLTAVDLGAGRTATAIAAKGNNTCALLDDGTVKCWGNNSNGQLGQGSRANLGDGPGEMGDNLPPIALGTGRTATAIAAGSSFMCGLLDDHSVKCWGWNAYGMLGQGSTATLGDGPGEMGDDLPAVNVGTGRTAIGISAGSQHACALLDDHSVKCWGFNADGGLGLGHTNHIGDGPGEMGDNLPPVDLGTSRTATAVSAGGIETCAVLDDASVKCWGSNFDGQLGQGSTDSIGDQPGEMGDALPPVLLVGGPPPVPGLDVVVSADESSVAVGEAIHLHVAVTNTGGTPLTGLALTDADEPGCEQSVPDLAVGQDHTVDCVHTATLDDLGGFANTATVDSDQTDPLASNEVAVAVVIPAGFGLVSGTVSETGSGGPVPGAMVAALHTSDFAMATSAGADRGGRYTMLAPVGDYYVYLLDPAVMHTSGFYGAPDVVSVAEGETTAVDPAMAPTTGAVTGTVTETGTGDPIEGALAVTLEEATMIAGVGSVSDADGGYTITGVPGGSHAAVFVDLTGGHRPEFYNDHPDLGGLDVISVTGGQTTADVDAALDPSTVPAGGANLAGEVTEDGTGEPLESVAVIALHAATYQIAAGDLTDASGHYDIDVDPGDYKLEFYDTTGGHRMEWHDDLPATAIASAATVTAPANIDASLAPVTGAASGTLIETGSGNPLPGIWVIAIGPRGIDAATTAGADGTWTLPTVPAGPHRLHFVDTTGAHQAEYWDDQVAYTGSAEVTIDGGQTAAGLDAALDRTP